MKKLKTNFPLDPLKFKGNISEVQEQNIAEEFCDWIGISIHMDSLSLIPKLNMHVQGILQTLNVNF